MQIAIISDIHGNLPALDAVLRDLEVVRPDRIVCLGDVAATGPHPHETLTRLRALHCPVVQGNTDAALLDPQPPPARADADARRVAEIDQWCARQLTAADLTYLRTFQPTVTLPLGNEGHVLCYHGSPRSYDDVITATTPEDALAPMFAGYSATVLAGGHWHFQLVRRYQEALLLNPGSVGLAYDLLADGGVCVPPRTEYALLTAEGTRLGIELRRVPYDQAATVQAMVERGMPHAAWWAAAWG